MLMEGAYFQHRTGQKQLQTQVRKILLQIFSVQLLLGSVIFILSRLSVLFQKQSQCKM